MNMKKILFLASFMLIAVFACSSVYAANMTAAELLATVDSNKTITLADDVTLTDNLVVPSDVEVVDLGGKTLTIKGVFDYGRSNPIIVNSKLEIKNGTIARDASVIRGSLVIVDGVNAELTLNGVIVDGKNVEVGAQGSYDYATAGVYVKAGASLTVKDSTLQNNVSGMYGGALKATGAKSVTFTNSTIKDNYAKNSGSAMGIEGAEDVLIEKTIISGNTGDNNGTVSIQKVETFTFDKDSVVKDNKAKEGAGIHIGDSNATIAGTIEGNEATTDNGGGLYTFLSDDTKHIIIEDTAVIKNNVAAGAGGGVYVNGPKTNAVTGHITMMGGLITGNTAKGIPNATTLKDGGGAGVYVARGNMLIEGGEIKDNTSTSGIGDAILVSQAGGNTKAGVLGITGGLVDGEIKVSDDHGTAIVQGGAFTDDVSAYLESGVASKEVNGVNYVGVEGEITVKAGLNGKATAPEKAVEGQPVKVTVTPNKNYEVASIKVTDLDGNEIVVKDNAFIMPDLDVTVEVTFKEMKKDGTPATGSMNVVMLVSAVLAVATFGVLVSKKYAKNN